MTLPVHWVESLAGVGPGDLVEVEGDEAHHAVAVRRLRAGEPLALTDGAGTTVTGVVARDRQATADRPGRACRDRARARAARDGRPGASQG